jgi:short-subunit dehydrogenase
MPLRGTWKNLEGWRTLMGVINGSQAFLPTMVEARRPGFVVTGSKQGITTPPGNAAYNASKAGLKAFTEVLQHELRNTEGCRISAHLLIPGFTLTGINARLGAKPKARGRSRSWSSSCSKAWRGATSIFSVRTTT